MKKTCGTFLAEHGLTLLTGTLLGATFTAGLTYESSKDLWQTVGTLCSGVGAIGVFFIALVKGNEWVRKITLERKVLILIDNSESLVTDANNFMHHFLENYSSTQQQGKEKKYGTKEFQMIRNIRSKLDTLRLLINTKEHESLCNSLRSLTTASSSLYQTDILNAKQSYEDNHNEVTLFAHNVAVLRSLILDELLSDKSS
ncbi:hypothetical protein DN730_08055 [Marinomonas piezotolerans]|uniref:Uncharacterized protein n=1 Tax=Marinomonas piezotolerans TaxID=2213058 RepID=A0A370U990_9GAMM|nr:hypothetical protein [Marinomonas piezotolerans]RDL44347.1 hypothetical protein DN730_08055 [Marinomonas piezotolerans]